MAEAMRTAFRAINQSTKIAKYRAFQFRCLNGLLTFNDKLVHYGISQTNKCTFCYLEKETIIHLFWECKITKQILADIVQYAGNKIKRKPQPTLRNVILNDVEPDAKSCINLIVLITKQHLYASRCLKKKLNKEIIINECQFIQKQQKVKAIRDKENKIYSDI